LEKVQARAVKNVSGMGGLQYEDQLKALELPSLAERRKEFDMVQVVALGMEWFVTFYTTVVFLSSVSFWLCFYRLL